MGQSVLTLLVNLLMNKDHEIKKSTIWLTCNMIGPDDDKLVIDLINKDILKQICINFNNNEKEDLSYVKFVIRTLLQMFNTEFNFETLSESCPK